MCLPGSIKPISDRMLLQWLAALEGGVAGAGAVAEVEAEPHAPHIVDVTKSALEIVNPVSDKHKNLRVVL
jgi:hypothetical protein